MLGLLKLLLNFQKSFEFVELSLEAHVWKDHRSLLAGEAESFLKGHVPLLHQISDDTGGGARDASKAMYEDSSTRSSHAILDEGDGCGEVSQQTLTRVIHYVDDFILEFL